MLALLLYSILLWVPKRNRTLLFQLWNPTGKIQGMEGTGWSLKCSKLNLENLKFKTRLKCVKLIWFKVTYSKPIFDKVYWIKNVWGGGKYKCLEKKQLRLSLFFTKLWGNKVFFQFRFIGKFIDELHKSL